MIYDLLSIIYYQVVLKVPQLKFVLLGFVAGIRAVCPIMGLLLLIIYLYAIIGAPHVASRRVVTRTLRFFASAYHRYVRVASRARFDSPLRLC